MNKPNIMRIAAGISLVVLAFIHSIEAEAQGVVSFTNAGIEKGVFAPISLNGELLGYEEGLAQLALTNGTLIGHPARFLYSGLFFCGTRVVLGIPPGEKVDLVVQVLDKSGWPRIGSSDSFSVVLGGAVTPKPSPLVGRKPGSG